MRRALLIAMALAALPALAGITQWHAVVARKNASESGGTDYTQDAHCVGAWPMVGYVGGSLYEPDVASTNSLQESASDDMEITADRPSGYSGTSRDFEVDDSNEYLYATNATPQLQFNGAGQSFSVAFWLKPETTAADMDVVSMDGIDQWLVKTVATGDTIKFAINDNAGVQVAESASSTVADGTWVHVACVADSGTMTVYINGSASGSTDTYATIDTAPSDDFTIGYSGSELDGLVDEVIVFSDALTSDEVNEIMDDGIDGTKGGND